MGHVSIPAGASIPTDTPTGSPWSVQGTAGNADVWAADGANVTASWLRVVFRPGHHFTDTGVAAALGQVSTYLTSGKVASVGISRHIAGFDAANADFNYADINRRSLHYMVAASDLAAQVSAVLAILNTGANVA